MPRLIVNADDFGMTEGLNRGIIEAHAGGILTSTSLMVHGAGAGQARRLADAHPDLSVGLHFVDDTPRLDDPDHAAREFAAQLERFRALMEREPTHVDSHHHVHLKRMETFRALAEPLGVPLRGDGKVRYIGAFFAHPRPGVVELERITEPYLLELVESPGPGEFSELGCHPGHVTAELRSSYTRERELELAVLTAPGLRAKIEALGLTLASYRDWGAS